jgi:hypothetical protein
MAHFALANKAKSPIELAVLIEELNEINGSNRGNRRQRLPR